MICYIFGASEITDYEYYREKINKDSYIICADGGIRHLEKLGISPDVIIGDFDSSNEPESDNKVVYPSEKDDTDLGLAIAYAQEKGFKKCVAIGCLGGRLDHTIASIHLLKYAYDKGIKLELIDKNTKVMLITEETKIKNDGYKYISVFPFGDKAESVTLCGLKYPLFEKTLYAGFPLGVSNEFKDGEAVIKTVQPLVVILIREDEKND